MNDYNKIGWHDSMAYFQEQAGETPPVEETPQIDCPLCGAAVRQVSSATLSLALWQHVNWACPNYTEITALRQQVKELQGERDAYKRDFDAELAGNAAMRERLGARPNETMFAFVDRLAAEVKTRDEQIAQLQHELVQEGQRAYEAGKQRGFHEGLREGRNEERGRP